MQLPFRNHKGKSKTNQTKQNKNNPHGDLGNEIKPLNAHRTTYSHTIREREISPYLFTLHYYWLAALLLVETLLAQLIPGLVLPQPGLIFSPKH